MRSHYLAASLLLAISLASPACSYGQLVPARAVGRLTGTVVAEATGQPVAYATVAVLVPGGAPVASGVSGADGQFALTGVPAGTYTLRISRLGYQDVLRPGVVVPPAARWPWATWRSWLLLSG